MENPNLLELVEAYDANGRIFAELAVCSDQATDGTQPRGMIDISLCDDEAKDSDFIALSLCSDPSDVRLKTDIEQIGTTVYGLPLYHFRYRTGPERFEGVMAQDVLQVMPDAVTTGEDGYYRVKYAQLGIRMTKA